MDVWIVEHKYLATGMRIEGFSIYLTMFGTEKEALDYAWGIAKEKIKGSDYDAKGCYVSEAYGGYEEWPEHTVKVTKKTIATGSGVLMKYLTHDN